MVNSRVVPERLSSLCWWHCGGYAWKRARRPICRLKCSLEGSSSCGKIYGDSKTSKCALELSETIRKPFCEKQHYTIENMHYLQIIMKTVPEESLWSHSGGRHFCTCVRALLLRGLCILDSFPTAEVSEASGGHAFLTLDLGWAGNPDLNDQKVKITGRNNPIGWARRSSRWNNHLEQKAQSRVRRLPIQGLR